MVPVPRRGWAPRRRIESSTSILHTYIGAHWADMLVKIVEGTQMSDLIDLTARLAARAHEGQVDKAGRPYIEHPARVAARVRVLGGSDTAVAAAWLHDVVEDSELSLEALSAEGIPQEVLSAVDALTKRPGEDRVSYLHRVRQNAVALLVKTADVDDNTDPQRVAKLDVGTRERLQAKYDETRAILSV